jgi:2Fe-2S ferredoxin
MSEPIITASVEKLSTEEGLMPKIRFLPEDIEVEVPEGRTILDAALDNNIKIDHNCGGNCACSTCHIYVEEGLDSLSEMSEDEEDMLDEAEDRRDDSRLACQCKVKTDLVVNIPPKPDPFDDETF